MTAPIPWRERVRQLKAEAYALYLASRHPLTPWYAKVLAVCVVAYALSPIDLIPDPIPILGYLDDLILVPLGIALAIKLIPPAVMEESREKAQTALTQEKPGARIAALVIIVIWIVTAIALIILAMRILR